MANDTTKLREYLIAQMDEKNTLSLDDALGAVEAWLEEQSSTDHPMFSTSQRSRQLAIRWLIEDEFPSRFSRG